MMLYNGAKKTFYLLILCINITKKTLFLAYKILIFDACQSLTAKYTTNYKLVLKKSSLQNDAQTELTCVRISSFHI